MENKGIENSKFPFGKRGKIFGLIYVVLFFAICFTPPTLWAFCENEEPIGNTEIAEFPSVTDEDGSVNTDFFSEFDDYFTEHLPLRPQLVTADNFIKAGIFSGDAANVITGRDGWIFSTETVDDYTGVTFSERKINNIARTVKIMQDKALATGNRFVFTVAPNKNTVYPEYMPSRYTKGESSNLSLLTEKLEVFGVNYADLYSALSSSDEQLYLKRDTHWNNLGALYGFNTIMSALGKEHADYNGLSYTYTQSWYGDLDKLLYPAGSGTDYQYYFDVNCDGAMFIMPNLGVDNASTLSELMSDSEKNDTLIKTRNSNASGSLLMVRDSFGRALLPYLINNYQSTTITRSQPFAMTSIESGGADVVYEIVERNLGTIVNSAPLMQAQECDCPDADITRASDDNIIKIDKTDSYTKIYGVLSEEYFDNDSQIYIVLESDGEMKAYEAFPICETELLGPDEASDYGFSVTLGNVESGSYKISAVISGKQNVDSGVLAEYEFTAD